LLLGSLDHYYDDSSLEIKDPSFVQLKHRQIWSDMLLCAEVLRDGKSLLAFESGDLPTKKILLTVSKCRTINTFCFA
jgi:hypothetical protein